MYAHRPGDVLDLLPADIRKRVGQLAVELIPHHTGYADAPGLGESLQPGGDIDAVAENVVAIGDNVAEIDADPKPDAPVFRHVGFVIEDQALHLYGAAHRIDDAGEFD